MLPNLNLLRSPIFCINSFFEEPAFNMHTKRTFFYIPSRPYKHLPEDYLFFFIYKCVKYLLLFEGVISEKTQKYQRFERGPRRMVFSGFPPMGIPTPSLCFPVLQLSQSLGTAGTCAGVGREMPRWVQTEPAASGRLNFGQRR